MWLVGLLGAALSAWAGEVRVTVLDVGQGDSILIQTPAKKNILIDAGDLSADVPPMLRARGVDHLDLVVGTHPHADHIGDMKAVLEAFPPKLYTDNGLPHTTATYAAVMAQVESAGIPYQPAQAGTVYNLDDGAKLTVLFPTGTPLRDTRSDLNSNSVVTRLTHGDDCFLFVGDAEEPTERALLNAGLGQCDVLKVAHHGSDHSTTPAFLAAVQPKIALISVGMPNRYRHPGGETLDRLLGAGIEVHRTDLEGALTVVSTGKGVRVETERTTTPELIARSGAESPSVSTGAAQPRAAGVALQAAIARDAEARETAGPVVGQLGEVAEVPTRRAPGDDGMTEPAAVPTAPPTASAGPPPDPAQAAACPFPASRSSEVFHEDGCGNAAKISSANLVCYPTREAAIAAGKRPAGCCRP